MIDLFNQFTLAANSSLGSTEGKVYYGNQNPFADDLSAVESGSYYLRDFESSLHLKYGPNAGDWIVANAGTATRSMGAILRTRNTADAIIGVGESVPIQFGSFDIATAPQVVRTIGSSSINTIESGTFVYQFWFSSIGDPQGIVFKFFADGVEIPHDRDVVSGAGAIKNIGQNTTITVEASNTTTNVITIQEFHCMVFKVDQPVDITSDSGGGSPATVTDKAGNTTELSELVFGEGIDGTMVDGNVTLKIDPSFKPTPVTIEDGTTTIPNITTIQVGDGIRLVDGGNGIASLHADQSDTSPDVFMSYSTISQSISNYFKAIVWDIEIRKDETSFSHNAGSSTIKILKTGWYRIQHEVSMQVIGWSSKITSCVTQFVNDQEIIGTRSYGYHRDASDGYDTVVGTSIVHFDAGDELKIAAGRLDGSSAIYTMANATRLQIESL